VSTADLIRQGVAAARAGRKVEARKILMQVVELDSQNELAWMWLSGLMDDLEDRIVACENVLTINPENHKIQLYLDDLRRRRDALNAKAMEAIQRQPIANARAAIETHPRDPLRTAEYFEQDGKYQEALEIYKVEAAKAKDAQAFEKIYKRIIGVEKIIDEKIKYVSPRTSIVRLTFTWPLLYLSLALVQVGLKPLQHLASYLWLAFPFVTLGSFLIAISEIRSRHVIWQKLFREHGDGSLLARTIVGTTGWIMVIIPFGLILLDSLGRLSVFQIPPRPY
jgi:tetratricopeptide (TPR) repeat protein